MSDAPKPPIVAGPPRPRFITDPGDEKVWDVVLALSTELAATRARLDALERLLAEQRLLPANAVETWQPSEVAGAERARELQAYTQRLFETLGRD